jgi:2-succinyl-6-hydroxy-2,4-cyclohexadiene-1-carboxylate synthase
MMFLVRPALVLLHGFTQTRQSWRRTVLALEGRYRALVPDLPGHGQSAQRTPSFDACDAYVRALAPDREPFVLAGYSMGGRIALHAALALRERLRALVLVGASPGLADPAERAARRAADEALARRIEAIGIEAFAQEWGAQPLFAGQPPRVAAAAHADRLRNTPAGLAAALRGLGTGAMPPLWDHLGELTLPVTLVVGERDEKFRALADRMAARLPAARVVVVPDAGHAVQLEAPAAVAAAIRG